MILRKHKCAIFYSHPIVWFTNTCIKSVLTEKKRDNFENKFRLVQVYTHRIGLINSTVGRFHWQFICTICELMNIFRGRGSATWGSIVLFCWLCHVPLSAVRLADCWVAWWPICGNRSASRFISSPCLVTCAIILFISWLTIGLVATCRLTPFCWVRCLVRLARVPGWVITCFWKYSKFVPIKLWKLLDLMSSIKILIQRVQSFDGRNKRRS